MVCSATAVKTSGPIAGGFGWMFTQYSEESWIPDSRMTVGLPSPLHSRNSLRPFPMSIERPVDAPVDSAGAGALGGITQPAIKISSATSTSQRLTRAA